VPGVAVDLTDVAWVVRALGDDFSLNGCARKLGVTVGELGYDSADALLIAAADYVVDQAITEYPGDRIDDRFAMLWMISERFLVARRLGQTMSTAQWRTPGGLRLMAHLGGERVEVDLVLALMTAWWEPIIDPSSIVADPNTGRPVDLGRLLSQHESAISRFGGRHFAEADEELRLWCLYEAVLHLLDTADI
jgi:hypothetical protein